MKPRSGKYTIAEEARRMIEAGHGLTECEIERFHARIEAIRQRRIDPKRVRNELRDMLESAYESKVKP